MFCMLCNIDDQTVGCDCDESVRRLNTKSWMTSALRQKLYKRCTTFSRQTRMRWEFVRENRYWSLVWRVTSPKKYCKEVGNFLTPKLTVTLTWWLTLGISSIFSYLHAACSKAIQKFRLVTLWTTEPLRNATSWFVSYDIMIWQCVC